MKAPKINALDYLIESGTLTPKQAGLLGLALNVIFALALVGFVVWGFNYNQQIEKHHCAAVCKGLTIDGAVTYYPDCDATGENVTTLAAIGEAGTNG